MPGRNYESLRQTEKGMPIMNALENERSTLDNLIEAKAQVRKVDQIYEGILLMHEDAIEGSLRASSKEERHMYLYQSIETKDKLVEVSKLRDLIYHTHNVAGKAWKEAYKAL